MDAVGSVALLVLSGPRIGTENEDESGLTAEPGATLCRIDADDLPPGALVGRRIDVARWANEDGNRASFQIDDVRRQHHGVR